MEHVMVFVKKINAAAYSVMLQLYLRHGIYNILFNII
jgi:hypothetical protein